MSVIDRVSHWVVRMVPDIVDCKTMVVVVYE